MVRNESSGAALYSPEKLFCMRLHFGGFLQVFPTSAQHAIFFGAQYFRHRARGMDENGTVGKSRQFCVD